MRYFIDTTVQGIDNTADDLIEAGFQFILDGPEIFFEEPVKEEDLASFNIRCIY